MGPPALRSKSVSNLNPEHEEEEEHDSPLSQDGKLRSEPRGKWSGNNPIQELSSDTEPPKSDRCETHHPESNVGSVEDSDTENPTWEHDPTVEAARATTAQARRETPLTQPHKDNTSLTNVPSEGAGPHMDLLREEEDALSSGSAGDRGSKHADDDDEAAGPLKLRKNQGTHTTARQVIPLPHIK